MTRENAMEELKIWGAEPLPQRTEAKVNIRHRLNGLAEQATKKYGIAVLLLAAFVIYGWAIAAWTEHKVTIEVTEAVTMQLRGDFQRYLAEQENARMAASLVTGEESRKAAAAEIADALSPLIAGLRMDGKVTKQGAYTYAWTIMSRLHSGRYGGTIHDVLGQEGQYEYYDPNHSCREEDRLIAAEIAEDYIAGNLPSNGFTWRIEFAVINADGSVTARDDYKVGNMTQTWRYPE